VMVRALGPVCNQQVASLTPGHALPGNDSKQVIHTFASDTKQHNLTPVYKTDGCKPTASSRPLKWR